MENFQRYFLMFSILIFSYFLLIRWDPPIQNSNLELEESNSERLLIEDSQNFEEAAPFNENLSNVESLNNVCAVSNIKTLETPYWSLDIDLKKGEIVKSTLKNYPIEIDSLERKTLFNKCGPEKYSQVSGFEFLNKELNPKNNFFSIKETYTSSGQNLLFWKKLKKTYSSKKL